MTSKRLLDLLLVLGSTVLWGPLLLVVAVLVRLRLGGPVFFRQRRAGRNRTLFTMVKFRTMHDGRAPDGTLLPDEQRLPPFGSFLRSTSLDELPGLWNVLRGDMSLVGPRPLLPEYLPLYSAEQARRHEVLPGITGWAQVNGRNAIDWDAKFVLDVWYVDHHTILIDLRVLWRTMWQVIKRDGISHGADATMPWFTGSGTCDG
jgi:lipopolysaccharide/colanic/teichoic acid biosynthesis glycosyltransferase